MTDIHAPAETASSTRAGMSATSGSVTSGTGLRECPNCGLFQHLPKVARGHVASCPRCDAVLRRHIVDPQSRALAMALTGLVLFVLAAGMPFMDLDVRGRILQTTLLSGPVQLEQHGMWEIGAVVLITTLGAPVAKLVAMAWVLVGLRLRQPPRHLHVVFRWVEKLSPWSMVEVFLLGVFVAYTKLIDLAHVDVGSAVYALGALMIVMAAADSVLDRESIWEALQARGITAGDVAPAASVGDAATRPIGCDTCGLVSRQAGEKNRCPRCGDRLHRRRPEVRGDQRDRQRTCPQRGRLRAA